jgi:hypothetical protein
VGDLLICMGIGVLGCGLIPMLIYDLSALLYVLRARNVPRSNKSEMFLAMAGMGGCAVIGLGGGALGLLLGLIVGGIRFLRRVG